MNHEDSDAIQDGMCRYLHVGDSHLTYVIYKFEMMRFFLSLSFVRNASALLIFIALAMAATVALIPLSYDTLHVSDTTFLVQVGSWVRQGAIPGVDFNHFYGGMHEAFIAVGLTLSGGTIKALDYALVLQFGAVSMGLTLLSWRRLDLMTTALLVLLCAIVLFARFPFEENPFVDKVQAAHSFAYNRFGTALTILCAVLLLVPSRHRFPEIVGGIVAGVAVTAAVLTKSTFFPIILAGVTGLIVMRRWPALVSFVLATVVLGIILDPDGARTLGTLRYSMSSSGTNAGESWLIRKAIRLIYTQQLTVIIIIVLLGLAFSVGRHALGRVITAVVVLVAFWAVTVAMGPAGLSGHQSLPVIAGVGLLLMPVFRGHSAQMTARVLCTILMLGFGLPHTLNFAAASAMAVLKSDRVALREGPMTGYLAEGTWRSDAQGNRISMRQNPENAVRATAARLAAIGRNDATTDYILLADAIDLVGPLPDLERLGLISDTRFGLGFALGTPRVDGFPVWLREGSPEMADGLEPLENASLVLLNAAKPTPYTAVIRGYMNDDFVACQQTPLWQLYVRPEDYEKLCSGS